MTNSTPQPLVIVIPARYASTRVPGKPLEDIMGKPMVKPVYERALEAPHAHAVMVATDDHRVADAVNVWRPMCHDLGRVHLKVLDARVVISGVE